MEVLYQHHHQDQLMEAEQKQLLEIALCIHMLDGELVLQGLAPPLGQDIRRGNNMISIEDKKEILNGRIEILNDLILRLEPFKNEDSGDKISNNTILENAKSEKNTYSQLLAEL